jgi:hypothetical protein
LDAVQRLTPACRTGAEGEGKMTSARSGRQVWTSTDDELLQKLVLENASPVEIATELKRSLSAVKSRAHRLGISLGVYFSK